MDLVGSTGPAVLLAILGGYFVIGTGYAAVYFGWHGWRVLGSRDPAGPSPVPEPTGAAYRPYPLAQAGRDLTTLLKLTGAWLRAAVSRHYRRFWRWFRDAPPPVALAGLPAGASLLAGTALLAVPLVAGAVALFAVAGATAVGWALALLVVIGTLGATERVRARRFAAACPSCEHHLGRPVYPCPAPGCEQWHSRLVPGGSGILRHACRCGASLPTLELLGKRRLAGDCPHCGEQVPPGTGGWGAPDSRPWTSPDRPGQLPRGYRAGRLVALLVAMPVAVLAGLAAPALLGWWLWSLW